MLALLLLLAGSGLLLAASGGGKPASPPKPASTPKPATTGLVPSSSDLAANLQGTAIATFEATEINPDYLIWGSNPKTLHDILNAALTWASKKSFGGCPVPQGNESAHDFLVRVTGESWHPTGSTWEEQLSQAGETMTAAAFNAATSILAGVANDFDPTGSLSAALKQGNAKIQSDIAKDQGKT